MTIWLLFILGFGVPILLGATPLSNLFYKDEEEDD